MSLPIVELLSDSGGRARGATGALLRALRAWCDLRSADPRLDPVARVAISARAAGLADALVRGDRPIATIVVDGPVEPRLAGRLAVAVTGPDGRFGPPGVPAVPLSPAAIDAGAHPPLPPLVRARWRHRLDLPAELVVALGVPDPSPIGEAVVPTALALASAATVVGPWTVTALALGTPVVTDAATATSLGARDGIEVVVVHPSRARDAAADLATDPTRAAALSRAGRRLVEARYDVRAVARHVLRHLGLKPDRVPLARLQARLDELGTPPAAPAALRAFAATAALGPDAPLSALTGRRR